VGPWRPLSFSQPRLKGRYLFTSAISPGRHFLLRFLPSEGQYDGLSWKSRTSRRRRSEEHAKPCGQSAMTAPYGWTRGKRTSSVAGGRGLRPAEDAAAAPPRVHALSGIWSTRPPLPRTPTVARRLDDGGGKAGRGAVSRPAAVQAATWGDTGRHQSAMMGRTTKPA